MKTSFGMSDGSSCIEICVEEKSGEGNAQDEDVSGF